MDKFFDRGWVIKLSSITIAVMLFLMVNMENQAANQAGGGIPGITDGEQTLEDVPLNIYYDEENYILTDAPETVEVNLRGPQSGLTLAQVTQDQQEVFLNLENEEAGVHYERVQHRGFQPDLRVSIVPLTVRVTLEERQTASFPVEIELLNEDDVADGYTLGEPEAAPDTVSVTAAESVIEQIDSARAVVDAAGLSENFTDSAAVLLYDEAGSELEIETDPQEVEITVPISGASKEVPLRVSETGALTDGMSVDGISLNPDAVTIYGAESTLNDISFIELPDIDLSEIEGDTTIQTDIPVPEGVERVEPEETTVNIEISSEQAREFSNFPITVNGLDPSLTIEFSELAANEMTLRVEGSPELLEEAAPEDFTASIDLSGLETGGHTVPLELTGPEGADLPQQGAGIDVILFNGETEEDPPPEEDTAEEPEPENEENAGPNIENNITEENEENSENDTEALEEDAVNTTEENTEDPVNDEEEDSVETSEIQEDNNTETNEAENENDTEN